MKNPSPNPGIKCSNSPNPRIGIPSSKDFNQRNIKSPKPRLIKKFHSCASPKCFSPALDPIVSPSRKSVVVSPLPNHTSILKKLSPKMKIIKIITPRDCLNLRFSKALMHRSPFNNYEFLEILGRGKFSVVRKALSRVTGKFVAIKSYNSGNCEVNYLQEIEILKKIKHANIIEFVESFELNNQVYIVSEYIDGQSLYAYLKASVKTRISENESKHIFSNIISALDYLHVNNISHGDLKLENVMITSQNQVKLIDFGFSGPADAKNHKSFGTSLYLSPEIVSFEEYSGIPADIWALGVMLYTALTGTFPFKATTEPELYKKIKKGCVSTPSFISAEANKLLRKMLKVNPKKRISAKSALQNTWLANFHNKPHQQKPSLTKV